jgi:hypothetical protein
MDRKKVLLIALAFGQQRTNAAGPTNVEIAEITKVFIDRKFSFLATQWEVELPLRALGITPDHVVSRYGDKATEYLSTKDVINLSIAAARKDDVDLSRIILVGHPLHLKVIRAMIRMKLWKFNGVIFTYDIDHDIHYDHSEGNKQWWTRGPIRFLVYLPLSAVPFLGHGLTAEEISERYEKSKRSLGELGKRFAEAKHVLFRGR